MAWDSAENRIKTSIGIVSLKVTDSDGVPANGSISGMVLVLDQNGEVMKQWSGDALPHLLASEKQAIANIMAAVRARAQTQFIG